MRLPWFFGSWPGGRRSNRGKSQRGRQRTTPSLRIRQLERRRVLDAAAASLVVGPTLDAGQESTVTTSVTTTEPLVFDWNSAEANSESAAAVQTFTATAQGGLQSASAQAAGAANTDPVVVGAVDRQINEGQLLDLSGTGGAPALGFLLDPDVGDTHTATVNWGDGSGDQPATVIGSGPAKPIGGTHTYADGDAPYTDYTVTVTVTDSAGGTSFDTFVVRVFNVDPTLTISGPPSVDEGSTYTLNLSSSDPGADTISSWEINWGDGNIETITGNPSSATHIYEDGPANYTITATATDEDGTYAAGNTVAVTVNNVAPTITAVNLSDTILDEGQSLKVSGTFTDPALGVGTESFTVMIDWGNGVTSTASVNSALGTYTASYLYADDHPITGTAQDTFSITVIVTDDDGGSTSSASDAALARSVVIRNVAPTITAVNLSNPTVSEGQSLTVSGTFTDPALGIATESFTVMIDWGNGETTLAVVDATLGTYTATYLYKDDHPTTGTLQDTLTIVVLVSDDDGGSFSSASDPGLNRTVVVANVAPTVSLGGVSAINENGTATLTGSYTDIGVLDQHVVTINWGDPNDTAASTFDIPAIQDAAGTPTLSVGQTFTSSTDDAVLIITAINAATGQVSFSVQHQYLDDGLAPGNNTSSDTSTISVTVADDDTGSNASTTTVVVQNVAPTLVLGSVSAINENGTATLTGSYTDIGLLDQHVVTINWGDANDTQLSTFNIPAIRDAAGAPTLILGQPIASSTDEAVLIITAINTATGQVSFSVQHQYLDDGLAPGNNTASDTHTISVTVADDDAGSNSTATTVVVQNVVPTVALGSVSAISENGTATLTGSYTDIGLLDQHVVTINWGDPNDSQLSTFNVAAIRDAAGNATLTVGQTFASSTDEAILTITAINAATGQVSFSVQHQYLDDGVAPGNNTTSDVSTISVTVADDDTGSNSATTTVTVQNVAPTLVLGSVTAINENGTATLTGSYTDIGLTDQHTLTVNWGDPNDSQLSTFAVNAIRNAAGTTTLTVGQTFASSTDEAVLTITAINTATGQVSFSIQHQYLDDGLSPGNGTTSDTHTIVVNVADDDTASVAANTSVLVQNVSPAVTLNGVPTISENGTATLTGSYTDIGLLDQHVVTINWGDPNDAQLSTFAIPAIRDASGNATLTVGQTISSSTDEAVLTITAINATTGQVSFSVQHQYLDDGLAPGNNTTNDISTISVTVTDDDTASNAATATVQVQNVAPSVALGSVTAINENGTATLTGSYTDIGLLDQHVVTINWGDPNDAQLSTFAVNAIRNAAGAATLTVGQTFASSTDEAVLTITAINAATGQVSFSVQHQYLDDGLAPGNVTTSDTSTISVTVADDDAASNVATTTVVVQNVAPTVVLGSVTAVNENGTATLTGSYTDIGLLDQHVVTINWGDPNDAQLSTFAVSAIRNAAGNATLTVGQTFASSTDEAVLTITAINTTTGQVSFSVQHQYLDDGLAPGNNTASDTSTISVTVSDDDLGSNVATTTVQVQNVAPAVSLGGVSAISENGVATLTGSYTDIGLLDQHVVTINWSDPNDTQLSTFAISAIRDASGNATLTVGQTISSSTDEAVLTITAINATTGQVSFSVQHQYLDDGLAPGNNTASDTSTISVTVADDDTGVNQATTTVVVNNVAPSVTLSNVSAISENGIATLNGSYTDIGLLDQHVVTINWGDPNDTQLSTFAISAIRNAAGNTTLTVGQTFASSTDEAVLTITAINATTGQVSFSVQHQYLDDGLAPGNNTASDTSTISVTVADDDTASNTASTTVLVQNVAPSVSLGSVSAINENGTATLTGSYTDIGLLDQHVVTINWGDPNDTQLSTFAISAIRNAAGTATLTVGQTFASSTDEAVLTITAINATTGQVSFSVQHQYLDDGLAPGNNTASDISTISVTVADDDTASNTTSTTVLVQNVAPSVSLGSVSAINENGFATLNGSYTDIGLLDRHVVTINWGDPNDSQSSTFAVTAIRDAAGTATLTVGQTFASSTDEAVLTITAIDATTGQVSFSVQHQYLDDGLAPGNNTTSDTSTISVTVADDDTASDVETTTVLVQNVAPQFGVTVGATIVENSTATITAVIVDPGSRDVFSITVNWQDGVTDTITGLGLTDIAATTVGGTTYSWDASTRQLTLSHHYNDDHPQTGTPSDEFPVSLVVSDDDLGVGNTSIIVVVQNEVPQDLALNVSDLEINESESLSITGSFTDRLINFPTENFRAFVLWGDGTSQEITLNINNIEATFASLSHTYLDNDADNTYTIRLRVADDDMGAFASPDAFLDGVINQDFVEFAVDVRVLNVNPTLQPLIATDVESSGRATVTLTFTDPGADSFEVLVNWGDRPNLPPDQQFVVERINVGVTPPGTPITYTIEHFYTGPPDPQNPTADIIISVVIHDDDVGTLGVVQDGISNVETIAISNPGIETINVAIDTTPQVPRLEFLPPAPIQPLLNQSSATIQSVQSNDGGSAGGDSAVSSERFLELVAYAPDGTVIAREPLDEEELADLRGLFARLPDGHYKIFLVRTDNNSRRLVIEVNVRNGRVIDPSDDSEGTRDRPPTSESEQQQEVAPAEQNDEREPAAATEDNAAMLPAAMPGSDLQSVTGDFLLDSATPPSPQSLAPSYSSLRWGASLAGLALAAGGTGWSRKVDTALEQADRRAWQRLRRAGRLGRPSVPAKPSNVPTTVDQG